MNENIELALSELNEQQKQAVVHQNGPLFVVAGAGTGKTKTLTTRIAYLINVLNVHPENILGVTFTNKAAREVRERVNKMIYPKQIGSWLYTFHAFCLKILKTHANKLNLGYTNDFSVVDEDDARVVVREVIKDLNLDNKEYPYRRVRGFISKYKTKLLFDVKDEKLYEIYDAYQNKMQSEQLMDFDDLLIYTHKLLKENVDVRDYYQTQFEHILVDEFQDTDKTQYEIIKLLSQKHKNVFVVGDPDQSIYAFRGARYDNNLLFVKDFNARTIVLDENYRSKNNILKVANRFIAKNKNRNTDKELKSNLGEGMPVNFMRLDSDYAETSFVANEIKRLINQGYKYEDIAILYRNNSLSRLFEHELTQSSIPYIVYGGLSFYERKEVKDILAYVRVIINPHINFYLKRIINVPSRKIGNVTITKLEDFANSNNISMFEAIPLINIGGMAKNSLMNFYNLIKSLQEKLDEAEEIMDIIEAIYVDSGYKEMLRSSSDDTDKERHHNVMELKTVFRLGSWKYEGSNVFVLQSILDEIALYTDQDKNPDDIDSVRISTIHQVKGLEFKVVFIVVLEETIFPNNLSLETREALEEERRVLYVALTRAEELLYITSARRRILYGEIKHLNESPFIREMVDEDKIKEMKLTARTIVHDDTYQAGDKIHHDAFGLGVVVSVNGDIITIAFSVEYGIKKLIKDHPALKKVN